MAEISYDYALPFAAWDLRLFLDTHPDNTDALEAYTRICARCGCCGNYACLPESEYANGRWCWIDDPWPWEPEANCPCNTNKCNTCNSNQCNNCNSQNMQRRGRTF